MSDRPQSPPLPPSTVRVAEGFAGQRLLVVPADRLEAGAALPVVRDLQITHIGHFQAARHHFIQRRKGCSQHILIYCLKGSGQCKVEGKAWRVRPGDLVLLPAKMSHTYFAETDDPWSILWVHFSGLRADDYFAVLKPHDGPVLHVPNIAVMQQAFEETYRHALDGFSDAGLLSMTTGLARLVSQACLHSASSSTRVQHADERILGVIRQLQEDPIRLWSVDEMAAAAGMSTPHFFDCFRRHAGCAPKLFLIRQRLQIATALMQQSDLTVNQIAQQVGYEDPYYFSRLFKRHTGQSPSAHRKELGMRE